MPPGNVELGWVKLYTLSRPGSAEHACNTPARAQSVYAAQQSPTMCAMQEFAYSIVSTYSFLAGRQV